MPTHNPDEAESAETTAEARHHKPKNPNLAAWLVSGSIVLGALIISASLFVNFHLVFKQLNGASLAQGQSGAPAAPSAAAAAGQAAPAAPGTPVNITLKAQYALFG